MNREGLTIKMDRKVLLDAVRDQMFKHVAEYKEALLGWKMKLHDACQKVHDDIVTPSTCEKYVAFPRELSQLMQVPQQHKEDFETTISMLESATDSVIELDQETYEKIVLGKFIWREAFSNTNSLYRSR
jgi:hypothetical protein